jgi:hypothetical protein
LRTKTAYDVGVQHSGAQGSLDPLIRTAIRERRLVELEVNGLRRVAEPHTYGERNGTKQLLLYQVAGASKSGHLPDWRWAKVQDISDFHVLDTTFSARPTPSGSRHVRWDEVFERVE